MIISAIMMVYLSVKNAVHMYYDCEYYWNIGNPVFEDGIHLLRFPETFRGYVWPMAVQIIRWIGEHIIESEGGLVVFRLVMSIGVAVFFSVVLPYLFSMPLAKVADLVRMIILTIVTILLWGDFFAYPLSDFAAVFFITVGIVCIKYHLNCNGVVKPLLLGLASGMMLYAAYNTRASYLYAIVFVLIYIVIEFRNGRKIKPVFLLGVLIGCAIIALPQSMINHQYTGSYSPRVFTEQYNNYEGSLEKQQVLWGLMYSNYESYSGPAEEYPSARVLFADDAGREIIARERITEDNFTYRHFLKLFLKYPFDMVSIYTRHFVSLMTPKFPEMYLSDMYPNKGLMVFVTIVIWFVTLINLLYGIRGKINWSVVVPVFAVFLPAFLQLLGAPEIRFFIAVHLIGYYYCICYFNYSVYKGMIRKSIIPVLVCFLVFAFLWIGVLSSVLGNNEEKVLLIDDRNRFSTVVDRNLN